MVPSSPRRRGSWLPACAALFAMFASVALPTRAGAAGRRHVLAPADQGFFRALLPGPTLAEAGWVLDGIELRGADATAVFHVHAEAGRDGAPDGALRGSVAVAPPDRCGDPIPLASTEGCVTVTLVGRTRADPAVAALRRLVERRAAALDHDFAWRAPDEEPPPQPPPPDGPPGPGDPSQQDAAGVGVPASDPVPPPPPRAPAAGDAEPSPLLGLLRAVQAFPLLFAILFLPGWLLLRRRTPAEASATERWALYAGVGLATVSLGSAALYALPLPAVGIAPRVVPPTVAAIVCLAAWWRDRRRSQAGRSPAGRSPAGRSPAGRSHAESRRATAGDVAVVAVAALAFALFFLGIDDAARFDSCVFKGVDSLYAPDPHRWQSEPPPAPLFAIPAHSRIGNALAFAVPHALHGPAGRRLTSGMIAALVVLAMAALGRRLTRRTWPGLAATGLLLVTDDVFGSQVVNQNLYAAAFGALFLLVLQPPWRGRWVLRSLVAAALFASRHIALVGFAALLYVALREARGERRLRVIGRHAGAFLLFTLPVWVVIGWEEARATLQMTGAMPNFPLHAELVRPPFVPLPLWTGWPVYWIGQWGLLAAGAIAAGLVLLWRRGREDGTRHVWWLYGLPIYLALAVQADWIEPEKMTIGLLLAPLWVAGLATLFAALARVRSARAALRPVGLVALAIAAFAFLRPLVFLPHVPEDRRLRHNLPNLRAEDALAAFERARWRDWPLLPRPQGPGLLDALPRKSVAAWRSLREPVARSSSLFASGVWSARWMMHALLSEFEPPRVAAAIAAGVTDAAALAAGDGPAADAAPVLLGLRLAESPTVAETPIRPLAALPGGAPGLRLARSGDCALTPTQFRIAPWDQPCRVAACLSPDGDVWVYVAPPSQPIGPDHPDHGRVRPIFPRRLSREARESLPLVEQVALSLPATVGRVNVVEIVYLNPDRVYLTSVLRAPDGRWGRRAPYIWRHN